MQDLLADFEHVILPDHRLVERFRRVLRSAWAKPSESFPQMLDDAAQLEGAYRLFNNERVTLDALSKPHAERTSLRAREAGCVLVVHDTTTVETPFAEPEDVGYLNTGASGYFAHVSLAVSFEPERPARPLGVLGVQAHFRSEAPNHGGKKKPQKASRTTARSTGKAFLRWERGVETSSQALEGCHSVIHVADREADSFPLFCKALQLGDGCVFRIRNDRLARYADDETLSEDWALLSEIAEGLQGQFERTVPLSRRGNKAAPRSQQRHPPREARGAQLQYSATEVELRRPRIVPTSYPPSIHLWLVRVWEPAPPAGEKPVEWMLLTTEPCSSAAEIMRIVDIYRSRWIIEDYFKTLKTVCKLEERQFETRHALLNVLAVFLPIAVHLLWLRTCARDTPDIPASEVFSPQQLEVLRHRASRKMPENPSAIQAIWVLASYGGHIASNGWPGPQVLGRAFVRLVESVSTWRTAVKVAKM